MRRFRRPTDSPLQAQSDKHVGIDSEFVIISGDRNLYSAVMRIVEMGFPVHVWSWKDGLAGVYTQQEEALIKVHLLDDYLEEIGFRENCLSSRTGHHQSREKTSWCLQPRPRHHTSVCENNET